jgi:hypothetical protein
MRLRTLECGEHHKGGTGSTLQLAKPRGASVSRLKGFMASQVFDALREQGIAQSVSLSPILYLKTADPLEITVGRDDNGFQGARCRRNPKIILIERGALPLGFPFD